VTQKKNRKPPVPIHTDNTLGKLEKLPINKRKAWSDAQPKGSHPNTNNVQ